MGTGFNIGGWEALSADVTHASSTLTDGPRHEGQSVRFLYGRSLVSTGTTFQLAGYCYSTRGFDTLNETALKGMAGWTKNRDGVVDAVGLLVKRDWIHHYNLHSKKRERLQVSISQRLSERGSLALTGSRQTYWNEAATTYSLNASFSRTLGSASYSISYGYTRYSDQTRADISLWLTDG